MPQEAAGIKASSTSGQEESSMKRIITTITTVVGLLLAGSAFAATASEAGQAIAAAKAAMAKTAAVHYQWTATPKFLKEAEAAEQAGKYDEAVAKAKHAEELAQLAYAQGEEQAKKVGVKLTAQGVQLN
jgi:hypothetical protein